VISKPLRLYRHIGRSRSGEPDRVPDFGRFAARARTETAPSRRTVLAELCRQMVLDTHAPAAVLVNPETGLPLLPGPDRSLSAGGSGGATHDLLAMARETFRTKLRAAILQANKANARTVVPGGRTSHDGKPIAFSIDIQPVSSEGEPLLLICFVTENATGNGDTPSGRTRRNAGSDHAGTRA